MTLSTTHCSHCGTAFHAAGKEDIYSIRVDGRGYLLEVMDGELIPGGLHYCSPECMFRREQGVTPENNIFDFAGLSFDTL